MSAAPDPNLDFEFDLWDEMRAIIAARVAGHERSQQTEIGPSGLGTPCVRKLAHRLANTPTAGVPDVPWRPTVGTAVHTWLKEMLDAANAVELSALHKNRGKCEAPWCAGTGQDEPYSYERPDGYGGVERVWPGAVHTEQGWHLLRWMSEWEVPVGTINGRTIYGHIDAYDRARATVDDWKIFGPKSLKDHHAHGMGAEYRVQANTYARGVSRIAKLPVERIALVVLPMNGELRDGYVLSEPYDPKIAAEAFRRARVIEGALVEARAEGGERSFFRKLKTAPDYCARCPWFAPGAKDFEAACPGDRSIYEGDMGEREFEGLI